MRWKILLTPLISFVFLSAAVAQEQTKLRIAIEGAFPPFSQRSADGELTGFDVDIARALCKEMKVECELVQQEWNGIIPGLLAHKYDLIVASMLITDERRKKVDFTRKYWNSPSRFVGRKDMLSKDGVADLAGKRIGVLSGSIQDQYVSAVYLQSEILRYQSQEEVYLDLLAGRLDTTLVAAFQADLNFLKSQEGQAFEFFGKDHNDPAYFGQGAGIALRKGEDTLREKLNDALLQIRENGTYQRINARYTSVDIYGG